MKILLAVQGTGNGHISRARDVFRCLEDYDQEVDTLVSGLHSEVSLGKPWTYKLDGLGFFFGKNGGIDYARTLKEMHLTSFFKNIRSFPITNYDLVISDFEPISAWSAQLHHTPCVAMSNQAAFLSPKTPRPSGAPSLSELIMRYFAPGTETIGFHFQKYDTFIHTPIIREEVRRLSPKESRHVTVYLPAHDDKALVREFMRLRDVEWHIFSKHIQTAYDEGNVRVRPVNTESFLASLEDAAGVITAAGFETSAEALFLGKKLLVIPMKWQYEQLCNAEALRRMGVATLEGIGPDFVERVESWLTTDEVVRVDYPDETAMIVGGILRRHEK